MKANINKKMITSIVSIVIVAGMALQSFATNIDLEAFVNKEEYMSKYYEIDWRIDEIDAELERLYKFTCTNVASYGGTGDNTYRSDQPFYMRNVTQTYPWYPNPIVDTSTEGYLRVNFQDMIHKYGAHGKYDVFEREVPASLCKWRTGFELYPNTTIKMKVTRNLANTTSASPTKGMSAEMIMGPFKKVPYITQTSYAGALMTTDQFFWHYQTSYNMYYAYGTDKAPTTWSTQMGSNIYLSNMSLGNNKPDNFPAELRYEVDIENSKYKYDKASNVAFMYCSSAMTTDLRSRDKVWLRAYASWTGELTDLTLADLTCTTWNYRPAE